MTIDNISLAPLNRAYQQHQDKLILIVVVLLSLYLIAFLAQLTWRLFDNNQDTAQINNANSVVSVTKQSKTFIDIDSIKQINLFGDAQAVAAPPEEEVTDAPETRLNLTLTGVVSSTDPEQGAAIIERNSTQNTYGIGEKIEGTNATVDKIYVDRVIIKNRLVKETLMLDGIDYDEAKKQQRSNQQTVRAQSSRDREQDQVRQQVQALRDSVKESPTSFAEFISISPHAPEGKLAGYRVSPGKEAEFFKQVGLQRGDIITEINGIDLSDMTKAQQAIKELQEAQSLQLKIERSGSLELLDIEMPSPTDP